MVKVLSIAVNDVTFSNQEKRLTIMQARDAVILAICVRLAQVVYCVGVCSALWKVISFVHRS